MITYQPKKWIGLIYQLRNWRSFQNVIKAVLAIGVFSSVLTWVLIDLLNLKVASTSSAHSLIGIVLGLFLVFRTNTAYDRWWEGRKLWGSLVNNTRNLALKYQAFLGYDVAERKLLRDLITAFVDCTREHLRTGIDLKIIDYLPKEELKVLENISHKPNYIAGRLYSLTEQLRKRGELSDEHLFLIDKELKEFIDILGACERIKNTPIPFSYSIYIKKFIFIYVSTLPFAFIGDFHYFAVIITMLISYILVSIELIGEEIEDPFGRDDNDLPTDQLSEMIRKNLHEIMIEPSQKASL